MAVGRVWAREKNTATLIDYLADPAVKAAIICFAGAILVDNEGVL